MKPATVDARVRLDGYEAAKGAIAEETGTVAVLGHNGNWDLIGAYACRHIIKVTAVAEVLKPREVFDEFVALREQWGMRILGHEGGGDLQGTHPARPIGAHAVVFAERSRLVGQGHRGADVGPWGARGGRTRRLGARGARRLDSRWRLLRTASRAAQARRKVALGHGAFLWHSVVSR